MTKLNTFAWRGPAAGACRPPRHDAGPGGRPARARNRHRLHRKGRLGRAQVHGGRGQSARGRRRLRDAEERRHRDRCGDRHPTGADPGRAAIVPASAAAPSWCITTASRCKPSTAAKPRRQAADEHLFQNPDGTPVSRTTASWAGARSARRACCACSNSPTNSTASCPGKPCSNRRSACPNSGFAVSPRLNRLLAGDARIRKDPTAAAYFYDPAGQAWPVGHILKNPALAKTLREIARGGADAFYKGHIARDIAAKVKAHPTNPGLLTAQDIADYRPRCARRSAAITAAIPCAACRRRRRAASRWPRCWACSRRATWRNWRQPTACREPEAVHLFSEVGRLAYADRNRYAADTDFVPLPGRGLPALIDKAYLAKRARL